MRAIKRYMQSLQESSPSIGRPTKYRPEFCEKAIECGKKGMGIAEIAAALDVTRFALLDWMKEFPSFSNAMGRAREFSLSWWEEKGRVNLKDGKESRFNDRLWMLNMTNRFPDTWRDRRSIEITSADGPIELASVDQLRAELERRGKQSAIDVSRFTDVEVIQEPKAIGSGNDAKQSQTPVG